MMMNLFSIFDPTTSMKFSLNWLSMMIMFLILPFQFWLIPSRMIMLWQLLINFLNKEFSILIKYSLSNMIMFVSLFIIIINNNFLGLFPYIFTASSHMSFCLTLSLTLWISMMIFGWMNFTNHMFMHLTPQGTPPILMPFMVIIESVSLIIRPLTLSIRLTANMIAGHLLLTLIGSSLYTNSILFFLTLIVTQTLLMILEIAVSFIQAYVFSILSVLYSSEI